MDKTKKEKFERSFQISFVAPTISKKLDSKSPKLLDYYSVKFYTSPLKSKALKLVT